MTSKVKMTVPEARRAVYKRSYNKSKDRFSGSSMRTQRPDSRGQHICTSNSVVNYLVILLENPINGRIITTRSKHGN